MSDSLDLTIRQDGILFFCVEDYDRITYSIEIVSKEVIY